MGLQVAAANHLQEVTRKEVEGRAKLGVAAFAEALLGIPKILAENSGYDAQVPNTVVAFLGVLAVLCPLWAWSVYLAHAAGCLLAPSTWAILK